MEIAAQRFACCWSHRGRWRV